MDIIKKGFGICLKNMRKEKNLTQEKLAEKIGINLRQLARIEAGESFVTSDTLLKICNVLETSPHKLFDFNLTNNETNQSDVNKQLADILTKIRTLAREPQKLEYITLAYNSLFDKNSLYELKLLIKGIELTKE